jgi:hypothetical protein
MSQNFNNAKIYKISNDYNDDIYIGSTCDRLVKRFNKHKSDSKVQIKLKRPLYKLINEIGFDRFRIQLICDYPCQDKYQLRQKEGEYIREMGTLNVKIEGRTRQEYRDDHKEIKYEKNKSYYEIKQNEILEYKAEKILCECGCTLSRSVLSKHKKTQKHHQLMEQLQ